MAQRRTHHVLGARKAVLALLQVARVVEHQILRACLDIDVLLPARFGSANGLEPQLGRKVHHVDRSVPGQVRQIQQAAHGLGLTHVWTAERMALGPVDTLLKHALLQRVDQRAVLAMHAQDTAHALELLQHLERLGIVQAQMVVGKVGLKRRYARLAHGREVGAIALVPLGERHMKGVVGRAGSVGAAMPLGQGIGHGHAAIGRRVVHNGRRAAAGSRARAGLKAIGCPIHAGPALHVRVPIDKAREHPAARSILDGIALGRLNRRGNPYDLIAIHGKIGAAKPLGRHECAVFDDDHNCSLLIDAVGHAIKIRAGGDMLRDAALALGGVDIPQLVGTCLDQLDIGTAAQQRRSAVLSFKPHKVGKEAGNSTGEAGSPFRARRTGATPPLALKAPASASKESELTSGWSPGKKRQPFQLRSTPHERPARTLSLRSSPSCSTHGQCLSSQIWATSGQRVETTTSKPPGTESP